MVESDFLFPKRMNEHYYITLLVSQKNLWVDVTIHSLTKCECSATNENVIKCIAIVNRLRHYLCSIVIKAESRKSIIRIMSNNINPRKGLKC